MTEINSRNVRSWSIMGMGPAIWGIAFDDILKGTPDLSRVKVLTADLARYSGLTRIEKQYKDVVFNVGIAEQNMVGIAAGFALEGADTYMTTYAPFMTYRCADQVRHFMGDMGLPLKAVGSAAGFSAGFSGNALLALGDMAFMRSIPGVTVLSPADCGEAIKLMMAVEKLQQPVYMRYCGATRIPVVYQEEYELEIGKPVRLLKGERAAILATGTTIVAEALEAAGNIEENTGITPGVYDIHTIKPMRDESFREIFEEYKLIVTVEEHSVIGGLGSAVMEKMASLGYERRILPLGADDRYYSLGSREYMLEQAGLTADGIAKRILPELQRQCK